LKEARGAVNEAAIGTTGRDGEKSAAADGAHSMPG